MAKVLLEPDFSALFLRYIVTVGTRTFQTYELTAWPCDLQTSCQANDHYIPEPTWLTSHPYLCYVISHINKENTPSSLSFFSPLPLALSLPCLSLTINLFHVELPWLGLLLSATGILLHHLYRS